MFRFSCLAWSQKLITTAPITSVPRQLQVSDPKSCCERSPLRKRKINSEGYSYEGVSLRMIIESGSSHPRHWVSTGSTAFPEEISLSHLVTTIWSPICCVWLPICYIRPFICYVRPSTCYNPFLIFDLLFVMFNLPFVIFDLSYFNVSLVTSISHPIRDSFSVYCFETSLLFHLP